MAKFINFSLLMCHMCLAPFYLAPEKRLIGLPVHLTSPSISIFSWRKGSLLLLIKWKLL